MQKQTADVCRCRHQFFPCLSLDEDCQDSGTLVTISFCISFVALVVFSIPSFLFVPIKNPHTRDALGAK